MKKSSKFLLLGSLSLIMSLGIMSCGGGSPTSADPTTSEDPTTAPAPFVSDVESNLEIDKDYNEHSKSYWNGKFDVDPSMWYINNLDKVPLPDPHVFEEDGVYYIVGTNDRNGGNSIDCYYTTDFQTYESMQDIYKPSDHQTWEHVSPGIYAPEIYCFDGVYYLYYSACDKNGIRHNSVVASDNVLGPYEPIINDVIDGSKQPVFDGDPYNEVLDATIFVDTDGQMYMYYAISGDTQHIAGVKMNSPYEADWSTKKALVIPGEASTVNQQKTILWEMFRGYYIAEAPFMLKSNGKYYLTYSANGCWDKAYSVCYAVSDDPLGNFVKPYAKNQSWTNLLIGYPGTNIETNKVYKQWSGFASGTGHHSFFKVGDDLMIAYHAHRNRDWNKEQYTQRYFAIDRVYFDDEGVPFVNGPTWSPQPLPEAISGYKNLAPEASVRVENVTNEACVNDLFNVDCYNLKQFEGRETVLGNGLSYIELTFDREYEIGGFSIYNSAYYESAIYDIKYIDFGNGNAIKDLTFLEEHYINHGKEFVHPNSAFTAELFTTVKTDKVTICFDLSEGGQINDIAIYGK